LAHLHWRWLFGFTCIIAAIVTTTCFFLLHETCAPIVLQQRKKRLEKENEGMSFRVEGQTDMGLMQKIRGVSGPFIISKQYAPFSYQTFSRVPLLTSICRTQPERPSSYSDNP